jgi:hypothetical protein
MPHWEPGNVDLPASGVTPGTYGDATDVGQFTVDAAGRITAASNQAISGGGGGGGGSEIGYDQITTGVNIVSTTEATGTTIIACAAHTFDGAPVMCEFSCDRIVLPLQTVANTSVYVIVSLFEGATQLTRLAVFVFGCNQTSNNALQGPICGRYRFTPSAASHTYTITAMVSSTSGTPSVFAGSGGTAGEAPAFCRFTKV